MLPSLFISHGSPMHALEAGAAGRAWAAKANALPRPRAIVIATAHWETDQPMLSANPVPPMIYDFGGFPDALYKIRYGAPGAPEVAAQAAAMLNAAGLKAQIDPARGLDHGTWVPLKHMFPAADVPVVQLSVQPARGTAHALQVGRALAALREDDILVIGSGHLTHNLRDWFGAAQSGARETLPYVTAFQSWMTDVLSRGDHEALINYRRLAPEALRAHPTEEHLLPLYVAYGAGESGAGALASLASARFFDGIEGHALAMDTWQFGTQ